MATVLTLCLTAACANTALGPDAGPGAVGLRAGSAGTQAVALDGQAFAVSVAPGVPGVVLTPKGAVRVSGDTVSVTRPGGLGQSNGSDGKRAAQRGCEQSGKRFNPSAIGRYAGQGAWTFAGACS